MKRRKRITEIFPWLLPLRKWQRKTFFYIKQYFNQASYSFHLYESTLPYMVFETSMVLINPDTGQDIIYQENKVHNLKLAAGTLNHLVIYPGETFSFWRLVRHADKHTCYKDGLVVENGQLKTEAGGGLCMMSNLLYWMFLHTELTIIERKGHAKKEFPDQGAQVIGVDATVSEGWIDLQIKNETSQAYQIVLDFDNQSLHGRVLANTQPDYQMNIVNGSIKYSTVELTVIEEAPVIRQYIDIKTNQIVKEKLLYTNRCIIGYPLPKELLDHDSNAARSSDPMSGDAMSGNSLANDALSSDALASDTMSNDTLSSNALASDALVSDALASDTLASDALVSDAWANDALVSDALANDALASDALANDAMANDDLASDDLASDAAANDALASDDLASDAAAKEMVCCTVQ